MSERIVTVIQYTAAGTSVVQGRASDPGVVAAQVPVPGMTVEVIDDTPPGAAYPLVGVAPPSAREDVVVDDDGPSAAVGPVGPDPAQEEARAVPAPRRARKRG